MNERIENILQNPPLIKVLVVEDSPVARELLVHILSYDSKIRVIGTASNGEEALEAVKRLKPDAITMDIYMPKMDGFEATRRTMETYPTPIVIVTESLMAKEVSMTIHAIEAGAIAVLQKPKGVGHSDYEAEAAEFVQTVKMISEVKVVKRWANLRRETIVRPKNEFNLQRRTEIKLIALGASTGGPPVLQMILSKLPKNFPVPVLIVQHMVEGFIQGFVEWLGQTSSLPVHIAHHGVYILPGHVYVAPYGSQMKVETNGRISLTGDKPENGLRPSVSYLFRSITKAFGESAVGVLLTGMGKDGANELKLMREKGSITITQDKESSVVYGMPGEAIKLNAAVYVLSPEKIATALECLVNNRYEEKVVNL